MAAQHHLEELALVEQLQIIYRPVPGLVVEPLRMSAPRGVPAVADQVVRQEQVRTVAVLQDSAAVVVAGLTGAQVRQELPVVRLRLGMVAPELLVLEAVLLAPLELFRQLVLSVVVVVVPILILPVLALLVDATQLGEPA